MVADVVREVVNESDCEVVAVDVTVVAVLVAVVDAVDETDAVAPLRRLLSSAPFSTGSVWGKGEECAKW